MTDEHEEGLAGDKQEMERIRKKIDVTDSYCIQQYGAGLELRMAELSGQIMTRVRAFEENDTQTLIRQLLDKLEDPAIRRGRRCTLRSTTSMATTW